METLAWILLWLLVMGGSWTIYTTLGRRALSQHLSEPAPLKVPDTEKEDQQGWQKQYETLLQGSCTHRFEALSLRWWQCVECNYQQPWYWQEGCLCYFEEDRALCEAESWKHVTHRHGNCPFHGRPNLLSGEGPTKL